MVKQRFGSSVPDQYLQQTTTQNESIYYQKVVIINHNITASYDNIKRKYNRPMSIRMLAVPKVLAVLYFLAALRDLCCFNISVHRS